MQQLAYVSWLKSNKHQKPVLIKSRLGERGSVYLNPLRDPLKVPFHHLHRLRGNFFKVSVHLVKEKKSYFQLLDKFPKYQKMKRWNKKKKPWPAYLFAGFDLQQATASMSRCRSHQRGQSLESSRSHQTQSMTKEDNPAIYISWECSVEKWSHQVANVNSRGQHCTFMSTSVQFWVAQAFSRISKMATVLWFMMSTSHRPIVSPAKQNLASSSCSSDHWGSLLASS